MDFTVDLPQIREEELEYFADVIRKSGKYRIVPVTSTPAPPTFQHETLNTPEREYFERHRGNAQASSFPTDADNLSANPPVERQPLTRESHSPYLDERRYTYNPPTSDPDPFGGKLPPRPPPPLRDSLFPPARGLQTPHFSSSRIPNLPEFSGEVRDELDFDMWRYDVNCLIRNAVYPEHVILEAIRKSLKGKARRVLLHLGEGASVFDILVELEGIYGSVSSGEKLKEKFYCAHQESNESVADYSIRLEQLLCKSNINFDRNTKNEMLCNRLWSGLRDRELRNASRYKFESVHDYGVLRRELRQMEQDIQASKHSQSSCSNVASVVLVEQSEEKPGQTLKSTEAKAEPACQFMSSVENKLLQQLQDLNNQMRQLNTRVGVVEKELQNLKKTTNRSASFPDNRGRWSNRAKDKEDDKGKDKGTVCKEQAPIQAGKAKEQPLNNQGSSQEGQ